MERPRTAICFPGQGTQYVGMGKDLLEAYDGAVEVFKICEDITGKDIKAMMLNGPIEELTKTDILQPALTALEIALYLALKGHGIAIDAACGHSLGEYPALFAAGILGLEDTLRLVLKRGALMEEASKGHPGSMAAVIGMERDRIARICEPLSSEGVISLANYNSPEQIIITGEKGLVKKASGLLKEEGARVVPLKVAGAYHSPLMDGAARKFEEELSMVPFKRPSLDFYSNVTGDKEDEPDVIRGLMAKQIKNPVLWYPIVKNMYRDGIRIFIEAGPKRVLSNLIKKSLDVQDVVIMQFEDMKGLKEVLETWESYQNQ